MYIMSYSSGKRICSQQHNIRKSQKRGRFGAVVNAIISIKAEPYSLYSFDEWTGMKPFLYIT